MKKQLNTGQEVMHDFSKNKGIIIDTREDKDGYNFLVEWYDTGLAVNLQDWYKADVLELAP